MLLILNVSIFKVQGEESDSKHFHPGKTPKLATCIHSLISTPHAPTATHLVSLLVVFYYAGGYVR